MIEHVWTIFCSLSIIDANVNNLSLINVIEQINVDDFNLPKEEETSIIPMNSELITLWARENDKEPCRGKARIQYVSPSGHIIKEFNYEIDLSSHPRIRSLTRIHGLPFSDAGKHHFILDLWKEDIANWKQVAKIPLHITIKVPEKK